MNAFVRLFGSRQHRAVTQRIAELPPPVGIIGYEREIRLITKLSQIAHALGVDDAFDGIFDNTTKAQRAIGVKRVVDYFGCWWSVCDQLPHRSITISEAFEQTYGREISRMDVRRDACGFAHHLDDPGCPRRSPDLTAAASRVQDSPTPE